MATARLPMMLQIIVLQKKVDVGLGRRRGVHGSDRCWRKGVSSFTNVKPVLHLEHPCCQPAEAALEPEEATEEAECPVGCKSCSGEDLAH